MTSGNVSWFSEKCSEVAQVLNEVGQDSSICQQLCNKPLLYTIPIQAARRKTSGEKARE